MRLDGTADEFPDGAYVARQSRRGDLPIPVALGVVDVFLLYQAIRNPGLAIAFTLTAFCAVTGFAAALVRGSARDGKVSFSVDARGVYFGPTGEGAPQELIPWSWIDCVVTFDRIEHGAGRKARRRRCVGVELNTVGVTERMRRLPRPPEPRPAASEQDLDAPSPMPWHSHLITEPSLVERGIKGWRLDAASLARAVTRYAPCTPIERRPTRPAPRIASIPATARELRNDLQPSAERDDHRNDR
ncbi:MAG: hypothetical protein FWJ90_14810 [Actinomadura sp.]